MSTAAAAAAAAAANNMVAVVVLVIVPIVFDHIRWLVSRSEGDSDERGGFQPDVDSVSSMNFVGSISGFADSQNPKPRPLGANRKLPFHSLIASTIACIHSADGLLGFAGQSLDWLVGRLVGWLVSFQGRTVDSIAFGSLLFKCLSKPAIA